MTDFFSQIIQKLVAEKIENPRLEARLMIAEALQCRPEEVYQNTKLTDEQQKKVEFMLEQRLKHKPLDKILGHREFYKYDFKVNEDVLSPRPDTEILLETALEILQDVTEPTILDLGCGSGCIIESLLKEIPQATGCAVDVSAKALAVARQNADSLAVSERLRFVKASWFDDDFTDVVGTKFDMIVSNPPYIPSADIETLDTEVKDYDPLLALDGGNSGYDSYERIAEVTQELLKNNGYILLEAGFGQAQKIADIFAAQEFKLLKIVSDLAGIERCVILQKAVAENKNN